MEELSNQQEEKGETKEMIQEKEEISNEGAEQIGSVKLNDPNTKPGDSIVEQALSSKLPVEKTLNIRTVKYMATCCYIGLNYSGFQTQIIKGKRIPSIQDALQDALQKIAKTPTPIQTSSRTDQGVNALGHPFLFSISRNENQKIFEPSILKKSLNMHLKNASHPISVEKVYFVHPTLFNIKLNSIRKEYNYHIEANLQDNWQNAFQVARQAAVFQQPIDKEKLQKALEAYVGTHNFQNFTIKAEHISHFECYVRTIDSVTVVPYTHSIFEDAQCFRIVFIAKSFLAYQIRFMVGIALQYALGEMEFDYFMNLIDPPEELTPQEIQQNLRIRAQPKGLILKSVEYPPEMLSTELEEFYPEYVQKKDQQ